ncbi:MAG: nuclear transport factor 2 family protein [Gemmatimonadales bacterium]|jgi:hypothetical protein
MGMDTRLAVELYFKGLETGDVSQIPLAENVRFVAPTVPEGVQGEEKVRELLAGVAAGLKSMVAIRILVDGEHSCAPFELVFRDDNMPPLAGVDCFRVVEGRIVEIQPFYDPRPLIGD